MGLDNLERGISLFAGAIAMVLAAVLSPHLFKDSWITDTAKPDKNGHCVKPFHLVLKICEHTHLTHPSDWLPQFLEILILGLVILGFAAARKRVGVAFAGLFLGLALGTVGLPFLFVGGWLIIRALRLQRYGDASFMGSSRKAREAAEARRQAGGAAPSRRRSAAADPAQAAAPRPATPPTPSKRYTPKKRPRAK